MSIFAVNATCSIYIFSKNVLLCFQEYTFTCALKKQRKSAFTQIKDTGCGQRKVTFAGTLTQDEVILRLVGEFGVDLQRYTVRLISSSNNSISFRDVKSYHLQNQTRFQGSTTIYLCLRPVYEKEESSIPQLSEVREYLEARQQERNEENDADAPSLNDGDDDLVPVYCDAKTIAFCLLAEKSYRRVFSRWGEFFLVPESDMDDLQCFEVPYGMLEVTPPLVYYMNKVTKLVDIPVCNVKCGNVIWKIPDFLAADYINWLGTNFNWSFS